MNKHILAIHRKGETEIDQGVAIKFCKHLRTVYITTGGRYEVAGDITDDIRHFVQCLDCMQIIDGDVPELNSEIPY